MSYSPILNYICEDRDCLKVIGILNNIENKFFLHYEWSSNLFVGISNIKRSWLGNIHPSRVSRINLLYMGVLGVEHLYHIRSFPKGVVVKVGH
jgi:hypothetical protein